MLNSISKVIKMKPRSEFITSDGNTYYTYNDAHRHECYLTIKNIFNSVSFRGGRKLANTKKFYLSRHITLECGIYRITIRNEDEMEALEYFFIGLYEKLGFPETFPINVNLEIYDQNVDGVELVNEHASWRVFDRKNYQKY